MPGRLLSRERLVVMGADRKEANLLQDSSRHWQSTATKLSVTKQYQRGGYAEECNYEVDWYTEGQKEGLQDLSQDGILTESSRGI
jgi:hypothetical protein